MSDMVSLKLRARLSGKDLQWIRNHIPGPEPRLVRCKDGPRKGRSYYVAETKFAGNERRYLNECVDSNWISSRGPFVSAFENAFASQAGCKFAIACSSGTTALHLIFATLGLTKSDEVIMPTFTMIAVANTARYTGSSIRLVDVEPLHFNIDPDQVEASITPRTKAIMAVHTYGHPAQMARLQKIAKRHNLVLLEDAAEAHGAEVSGQRVGSFGLAAAFSFYANKVITTGEGGMVTTNDAAFARLARRLRDHAFHPRRHFWHEYAGFNYRMTNVQAALGLAQTERIDEIIAARRRLHDMYVERLGAVPGLELATESRGYRSVFWMNGVQTKSTFPICSYDLRRELAARGIETRSFFVPLHMQPIYAADFQGQRFPVAEALCSSGFYLPTHETLSQQDVDWIGDQIEDIRRTAKRTPPPKRNTKVSKRR